MSGLKLYTYWRSGAAHRVRIALALKGIPYESVPLHLVRNGGEHLHPDFRAINPQARVPVLHLSDGTALIQSSAILDYLEEVYPEPSLLPSDAVARARVRGVAAIIGSDVHPLNNVGPLNALRAAGLNAAQVSAWITQWVTRGLTVVEALIGNDGWCFGDQPTLADIYLMPQVYSARRFSVSLDGFARIARVSTLAASHPAFIAAMPENQPDAD